MYAIPKTVAIYIQLATVCAIGTNLIIILVSSYIAMLRTVEDKYDKIWDRGNLLSLYSQLQLCKTACTFIHKIFQKPSIQLTYFGCLHCDCYYIVIPRPITNICSTNATVGRVGLPITLICEVMIQAIIGWLDVQELHN